MSDVTLGKVIENCGGNAYGLPAWSKGYCVGITCGDVSAEYGGNNEDFAIGITEGARDSEQLTRAEWLIASAWADNKTTDRTIKYIRAHDHVGGALITECYIAIQQTLKNCFGLPPRARPWMRKIQNTLI